MDGNWVILGVGNWLRSDDGVGIHAARELLRNPPADTRVVEVGTDFLSALPHLESARRALILDAVHGPGAPGTLYRLPAADVELRPETGSAHATSVFEARRFLPPNAPWPEIHVLGVEPLVLDYGLALSQPVADALPRLVARAREIISEWRDDLSSSATHQVAS